MKTSSNHKFQHKTQKKSRVRKQKNTRTPINNIINNIKLIIKDLVNLLNNKQYYYIYIKIPQIKIDIIKTKNTLKRIVNNSNLLNNTRIYNKLYAINSSMRNYTISKDMRNIPSDKIKLKFLKECQSIGQRVGKIQLTVHKHQTAQKKAAIDLLNKYKRTSSERNAVDTMITSTGSKLSKARHQLQQEDNEEQRKDIQATKIRTKKTYSQSRSLQNKQTKKINYIDYISEIIKKYQ